MSIPTCDAILLGAGSGVRFAESGGTTSPSLPKQFQPLNDQPVFLHALKAFLDLKTFRRILLVVPKAYLGLARDQIQQAFPSSSDQAAIEIIAGGSRRQDSSRVALDYLASLDTPPTRIVLHDACRPFLSDELLSRMKECILDRSYGAWVPVVPVVETLKRIENNQVVETVDRSQVARVQTPQVFEFTVIQSLHEKLALHPEINFTDDASLCEYYGIPVGTFEGDVRNIKLTYDFEMETLRLIVNEGMKGQKCVPESASTFTA